MLRNTSKAFCALLAAIALQWGNAQSSQPVLHDPHLEVWQLVPDNDRPLLTRWIQFSASLSGQQQQAVRDAGIHLFSYISDNTYLALIPSGTTKEVLEQLGAVSAGLIPVDFKMSAGLAQRLNASGDISATVMWPEEVDRTYALGELASMGVTVDRGLFDVGNVASIKGPASVMNKIAGLDFIVWMEESFGELEILNYESNQATRVTAMTIPGVPGRDLDGKGVLVGIGDGGGPIQHIDFRNRMLNYANSGSGSAVYHAYLVTGMVGGAGNRHPRHKGPAPGATLFTEAFANILNNVNNFTDRGGVLTNNSYGSTSSYGTYTATSSWLDRQVRDYPHLLHVFAAGNSGTTNVWPYSGGFGSILGHYQSAKNIIAVGNLEHYDALHYSSSKGPTGDGRIKPDLCGVGRDVVSTVQGDGYGIGYNGTSFASPGVTGAIALMYQRHRQLNGGADPDAALIKALACNTADDLGNPGPDYSYGWGRMNVRRAVEAMERGNHVSGELTTGQSNTNYITVPSGAVELSVMICWTDQPGAPYTGMPLVNDLDLKVITPTTSTELPFVLDYSANGVTLPATQGIDRTNNLEQVVIENPTPGTYQLIAEGFMVPLGPQKYHLVYEIREREIVVTYPAGGEQLAPGETEFIRWDAAGLAQDRLTVSYSSDNGASWTTINDTALSAWNVLPWTVPSAFTSQGIIRVSANNSNTSGQSLKPFTVITEPSNLALSVPCAGFIEVNWDSIPGAGGYEVLMLDTYMQPVMTVQSNNALLSVTDPNKTYWIAVRALTQDGSPGRHCYTQPVVPNAGAVCGWPDELALDGIVNPGHTIGRQFTSTGFGLEPVTIAVINRGSNPVSGFTVGYEVDGFTFSETPAGILTSGDTLLHTFSVPYDFTAPGVYSLNAGVSLSGDVNQGNNELSEPLTITHLENSPVALPFLESFDSVLGTHFTTSTGLSGMPHADFESSSPYGQLRYNVTGLGSTGTYTVTLDVGSYGVSNVNRLTFTVNLSSHLGDTMFADFSIMHHGEVSNPRDSVWIRGSDSDPWIGLTKLDYQWPAGTYKTFSAMPINDVLTSNAQQPSSSFQIRFGQEGHMPSIGPNGNRGYTLDNIRFYTRPLADAGRDTTLCETQSTTLGSTATVSGGVPPYTYSWTPSTGLSSDSVAQPLVNINTSITYSLTITDALGQQATDQVTVNVIPCVTLEVKVMLQGPFDATTGLMRDDLRKQGLIPTTEPYTSLGYNHVGTGGDEAITTGILDVTGDEAVVDWIVLELRDPINPSVVVATESALLKRNGTVIPASEKPMFFEGTPSGTYHLAVRHRNHLGVMTKDPVSLGTAGAPIDFTQPESSFGTNAQAMIAPEVYGLWAGNVNGDKVLEYSATSSDRAMMLPVLTTTDLTRTHKGYTVHDINMDGTVKYVGKTNDRAIILRNVGGTIPENIILEQTP